MKEHNYKVKLNWVDENKKGTTSYEAYSRNHFISVDDKPELAVSADPAFRGDQSKYNPEDMLVASLSSCHMLWYLHLCSKLGITVIRYEDSAIGLMEQNDTGGGKFRHVTLNPVVTILQDEKIDQAMEMHHLSHEKCYIASSVNFPVKHNPTIKIAKKQTVS